MKVTSSLVMVSCLLALHAPSAAAYACYETSCDWDRVDEDRLQSTAQAEGRMQAAVGEPFAADPDVLLQEQYLVIREDVQAYNRSWDVLVEINFQCQALVTLQGAVVPGYENLTRAINGSLAGLNLTDDDTLELNLCGSVYAGLQEGKGAAYSGGQLRFQTGTAMNFTPDLSKSHQPQFDFWSGVIMTASLGMTRAPDGSISISLSMQTHLLLEGDLGWGDGTVRIEAFDGGWHRQLVALPYGEMLDQGFDLNGAGYVLREQAQRESEGLTSQMASPTRLCLNMVVDPIVCRAAATMPASVSGLASARLLDAYHTGARIDRNEDVAVQFVETCTDLAAAHCGSAGAQLLVSDALSLDPSSADNLPEHTSEEAGRLYGRLATDTLTSDLERFSNGIHLGDEDR